MTAQIDLTPAEIMQGAIAGVMRQTENLKLGRKPAYGAGRSNDWQLNIEGALGEMALAKHLDKYWHKGTFRGADVGQYQCRTSSRDNGDLILHPRDGDKSVFFLVTGRNGSYVIRGWIHGAEGKREEFWRDPAGGRPAFFVPQSVLKDVA